MGENSDSFDMEKMLRTMEMAKIMMENTNSQNEEYSNSDEQIGRAHGPQNDFDGEIQTEVLRSVKAAIPFLDMRYRKNLSIIIKLLEIQMLSAHYDEQLKISGIQSFETQNLQAKPKQTEMLRAMRAELSGEKCQKIDTLINMMDALAFYKEIKEMKL